MFDIYTGLRLDEAQVKAGRETEVERMLEFEVYEKVRRGTGPWQEYLEQCLDGLTEETRSGEVDWSIKSEVHASAKTCLRPHHHLQQHVSFRPVLRLVVTIVASACGMFRWNTGYKFTLAKIGAGHIVPPSTDSCIQ